MESKVQQVPLLGPILKEGLSPGASDALRHVLAPSEFWRIGQTDGGAAASAGTHEPDGLINGLKYAADVDFHVHDWNTASRIYFANLLASHGFAAWLRVPGEDHWPSSDALHIHAAYCGVPMKFICRQQVHDAIHDRNGLASHALYRTFQRPESDKVRIWTMFTQYNPADN